MSDRSDSILTFWQYSKFNNWLNSVKSKIIISPNILAQKTQCWEFFYCGIFFISPKVGPHNLTTEKKLYHIGKNEREIVWYIMVNIQYGIN